MYVLYPSPGDLIQFEKNIYSHWGVLAEDRYVIHVQLGPRKSKSGLIKKEKLENILEEYSYTYKIWKDIKEKKTDKVVPQGLTYTFVKEACWASVNNMLDEIKPPLPVDVIIQEAESWIGKQWEYHLLNHNCEHFAHWCRYGIEFSRQAPNFTEFKDTDGTRYFWAQLGGTNIGPVDFKLLSFSICVIKNPLRHELRMNYEAVSIGISNLARASFGLRARFGYFKTKGYEIEFETGMIEIHLGPIKLKFGLSVSTGVHFAENATKVELLGSRLYFDTKGCECKVLGNGVYIRYPSNWFEY